MLTEFDSSVYYAFGALVIAWLLGHLALHCHHEARTATNVAVADQAAGSEAD